MNESETRAVPYERGGKQFGCIPRERELSSHRKVWEEQSKFRGMEKTSLTPKIGGIRTIA